MMDKAAYPLNVARAHEKLLRELGETLPDTAGAPTTTTDCLYCDREMRPGDSVTVDKYGKIISCQHWNL